MEEYLNARVEALENELQCKNNLLDFYQNNPNDSVPATRCNDKPHIKYPACFEPLN